MIRFVTLRANGKRYRKIGVNTTSCTGCDLTKALCAVLNNGSVHCVEETTKNYPNKYYHFKLVRE